MFMGLAIVADDYFVPALDKLAESKYKYSSRIHQTELFVWFGRFAVISRHSVARRESRRALDAMCQFFPF